MRKIGDTLTFSSFQTSDGVSWNWESLKDKRAVVFFFYPANFTRGCTKEVCSFRDIYGEIEEAGGAIFGVSLDSEDSHEKFRAKHRLPFALISDESKTLSKAFDVLRLGGFLKVRRATFVVEPRTQKIVDAFSNELNMDVHGERVLKRLLAETEGVE